MPEFKSNPRWRLWLLRIDAFVDSAAWNASKGFSRFWGGLVDYSGLIRLRGWKRAFFELASEGTTLGAAGSIVLLLFAIPAFKATEGDWRARGDYAVTFEDKTGAIIGRRGMFLDDSVPLSAMPPYLIQATLATEDRRFYDHFGIDPLGTMRAIVSNAKAGGVVQGGSTITQQLAKNLFLSNERTLQRKVNEAYLALWLEAQLSKDEILKLYLDRAYMGGGTHGVAAASEYYFGKSVRSLTLAEAAMLSGLYKAPTKYSPNNNLAAARARANQVLSNLVEGGFMTEAQVASARRNPATPVPSASGNAPDWFLDWAFEEVKRIAPPGDRTITVRTTLDPSVQKTADAAIAESLRKYGQQYKVKQAATVVQSLDGAVRAMVGGSDYGESLFNRAVYALRQPGSSFKPFVYATAFMNGYAPEDMISDAPITIGNWSPRNYGRSYAGRISLRTAIAKSINTVPVRLAESLGRGKIVDTAHKLGIRTELKITRALPLGVAEVTALDMAGAYSGFATGGIKSTPYAIEWTKTRAGVTTYDRARDESPPEQVLPEEIAYEMNSVLSTVVNAGTGGRARFPGQMQAGKTGTTQAYRDAWFVGYTGWYAASVWFGNDDYTSTANMTGGSLPAITWHSIMEPIHAGLAFKPIPGVPVSADVLASVGKPAEVAAAAPTATVSPQALTPAAAAVIRDVGDSMRARVPAAKAREAALVPAAGDESISLRTPSDAGRSNSLLDGLSLLGASDAALPR
ncbi:PBP1A family penicillin-binding protein [Pleomorphomonas sp. NRKKF1]|uniref:transglycosylase domain-containing protein n=1 Tax=Pleomorphomonas sp. NRK KF1 TaxID=2943000 RepID=UPI0020430331|nr:PBP1A family penicillin-binding protein [Pleomorphomonas sp. NRK KF1]